MTDIVEKKKRLPGEGTVEGPSPTGMYRFKCPDGHGVRIPSEWKYATYEAAEEGLLAFRAVLTSGNYRSPRMRLNDYWKHHYLPDARGVRELAESTLESYTTTWKRWQKEGITDMAITEITRQDIRAAAKRIARTVERPEKFVAVLHTVLEQARADDMIENNPADRLELDLPDHDPDELRPTPEEIAALLSCPDVTIPDWHAMATAIGFGPRPGEWRSLEIVDTHPHEEVPYAFIQYGGDDRAPTKTRKKRRVPLLLTEEGEHGLALRALLSWLPLIEKYHPHNPLGLVFPSPTGRYRRQDAPFGRRTGPDGKKYSRFRWYLQRAGITRRLTPHCLRHAFGTEALIGEIIGRKMEVWQSKIMMGHERITTTLQYTHVNERDLFKMLKQENKLRGPGAVLAPPEVKPGTARFAEEIASGERWCRREDSNLRKSSEDALQAAPEAISPVGGPSQDRITEARALLLRIANRDIPSNNEVATFIEQIRNERIAMLIASDPILLATEAVAGDTWLPGLIRLLDHLIPEREEVAVRKDGVA